jgi:dolichol-phosphate mannosyltransferase
MSPLTSDLDLSVIIPAINEQENLSFLLPELKKVLERISITYEIIVVDETAGTETKQIVIRNSCIILCPDCRGYGAALKAGFGEAKGNYILTMDADLSHSPKFVTALWEARNKAEIIIASRYIDHGKAIMPLSRLILSRVLNQVFSRGLDLHVKDMSSGFRLYKASTLMRQDYKGNDFNFLQEVLVDALIDGFTVIEIPFTYQPREHGSSHARVFKFGLKYLQTFYQLWKLRNSIASADYDYRAYVTLMPPQRYWQRRRYKHITGLVESNIKCLDIGCGSSRILGALFSGSIGLDIQMGKLRFSRSFNKPLINGSALMLPISTGAIKCIICSQVIEHIPRGTIFQELDRVLGPNGLLILGTPDYSKWQWLVIEKLYKLILPQAYADEHITHYSYREIVDEFKEKRGYSIENIHYILQGELIIALRKRGRELNN